jgi:hypothetical protein
MNYVKTTDYAGLGWRADLEWAENPPFFCQMTHKHSLCYAIAPSLPSSSHGGHLAKVIKPKSENEHTGRSSRQTGEDMMVKFSSREAF